MSGPKAARYNLRELLERLRAAGVAEAAFHPDGRLAAVTFAGAMPTKDGELPGAKPEPRQISAARRAFEVLNGQRDSLEEDKKTA